VLKVALVGCGGMARSYRQVYTRLDDVQWAVAVDPNEAELAACAELGAKRTSTRFEDALADDVDIVEIATPNHLHEQQAVAALGAGKHVLLQKPMANSLEAADRIVAAARESGRTLGMYMSSYAEPIVWEVKRMLDQKALGEIQSVRARDAHRGGLRAKPGPHNWRGNRDMTGGGSFIQLSVHAINLMQWWLGARIEQVAAFSDNRLSPNIGGDDVTAAAVRFANGVYGTFDSGYASDGGAREIYGTRGSLRISHRELELRLAEPYGGERVPFHYDAPGKLMRFPVSGSPLSDAGNPTNPQRMFVHAVRQNKRPLMTGEDGRQDLAVVMAAYESAQTGKAVAVR
jgi:predicted dehydrogenase